MDTNSVKHVHCGSPVLAFTGRLHLRDDEMRGGIAFTKVCESDLVFDSRVVADSSFGVQSWEAEGYSR
jgi:hypothetical protein